MGPPQDQRRLATAIVDARSGTLPPVHTPHIDPERARAATLIVHDVQGASGDMKRESAASSTTSVPADTTQDEHRRATPTEIDAGDGLKRSEHGAELHSRRTVQSASVPPLALLDETESSSASTQPTPPPPEFRSLKRTVDDEAVQATHAASTQPAHPVRPRRGRGVTIWLLILSLCAGAGVAVSYTLLRLVPTQAEYHPDEWDTTRARAEAIRRQIKRAMLQARPDIATSIIASHPDVSVVRTDGSTAFLPNDWTTYERALQLACDTPNGLAARWVKSRDDQKLAALGEKVCPPNPRKGATATTDTTSHTEYTTWSSTETQAHIGESSYLTVPVPADKACSGCHKASGNLPRGWIVVPHHSASVRAAPVGVPIYLAMAAGSLTAICCFLIASRRKPQAIENDPVSRRS